MDPADEAAPSELPNRGKVTHHPKWPRCRVRVRVDRILSRAPPPSTSRASYRFAIFQNHNLAVVSLSPVQVRHPISPPLATETTSHPTFNQSDFYFPPFSLSNTWLSRTRHTFSNPQCRLLQQLPQPLLRPQSRPPAPSRHLWAYAYRPAE